MKQCCATAAGNKGHSLKRKAWTGGVVAGVTVQDLGANRNPIAHAGTTAGLVFRAG